MSTGRRDATLDVAKGLAMVLIVVGHVTRGLSAAHLVDPGEGWYEELDTALYSVHLPVFMLLSAAFLEQGVRRRGTAGQLRLRLVELAWVFVLWTAVQGTVQVLAGGSTNARTTWGDVLRGLWLPIGQFWFLPTLAVLTTVTVLIAPWRSRTRAGLLLAVAVAVSLARWGHFGDVAGTQALGLAIFFALGALVGHARISAALGDRRALVVGGAALLGYVVVLGLSDPTNPSDPFRAPTHLTVALGVLAAVAGATALLVIASLLAATPGRAALAYVGRHSLEIFVSHITAASGSRVLLVRVGVDDPWVLVVLGVAAGLLGPLVLIAVVERTGARWVFRAPAVLLGTARPLPARVGT